MDSNFHFLSYFSIQEIKWINFKVFILKFGKILLFSMNKIQNETIFKFFEFFLSRIPIFI